MDSNTHLDYVLFQLTPTRTRRDLAVYSGGKSEKLASGLVEPFISHLKFAKDQIPKGTLSAANEIAQKSPDFSKFKGKIGAKDVAEQENSKICLQRTLETRKVLLRKVQAMAYAHALVAHALVAGFEMEKMDDLILFADTFGAEHLREACLEFKEPCKKKLTDAFWMTELAAMAASPPFRNAIPRNI